MSVASLTNASIRLGERTALDRVSFAISSGETIAMVGPNGAGKSTALRALIGLAALDAGEARLAGSHPSALKPSQRGRLASYLPQERISAWSISARDLVALGLFAWGVGRVFARLDDDHRGAVAHALAKADAAHLADRPVHALSGGEQARVHLARALVAPTPLLVADEPAASLDLRHQLETMQVLAREAQTGRAVLIATHDLAAAARWADRILVLDGGMLIADGPPGVALSEDVLARVFGLAADGRGGYAALEPYPKT
ncbi:MAG: ABC transporter ATP-binding protein [Pseudomonadota bacterium]